MKMHLFEDLIISFNEQIVGFVGKRVDTRGYVNLRTHLGMGREAKELRVRYLLGKHIIQCLSQTCLEL